MEIQKLRAAIGKSRRCTFCALQRGGCGSHPIDPVTNRHHRQGKIDAPGFAVCWLTRRFRHMPVVERDRLIGLVSIGDLVKMHVGDAEFETAAMRGYIITG